MSYDLAVFDPSIAPAERAGFLDWFRVETDWARELDYNNPDNLGPVVLAFFMEHIEQFPPMNGPLKVDSHSTKVSDYSCAPGLLYIASVYSEAQAVFEETRRLAAKHECGFFDVTSIRSTIWIPDGNLGLRKHPETRPWWKIW